MSSWRPARKRLFLDLTSLIDVVFTLLLFVVVTAQFTPRDELPVALPQGAAVSSTPRPSVTVTVDERGVAVGGVFADDWVSLLRSSGATPVLVSAAGHIPYERVFAVLDALRTGGWSDVALAYERRF